MEKLVGLFKFDEIDTYTHKKRLREELDVFKKLGLIDYIVQVAEIYNQHISKYPVLLRGSAGSSLLLYYLGLNKIDPVKHSILLSRFINLERKTLPDIDFDLPSSIRNQLIDEILESNPNAVRMTSCANGDRENNDYWDELVKEDPTLNIAHSSGIIIYSNEQKNIIDENLVLPNQIGLTKDNIGEYGLKKIDILSNTALEQLYKISSTNGKNKQIYEYDFNDKSVFDFISQDDGIGITFAETPSIQNVIKILKPSNIEELSICLSLVRPLASHNINSNMTWENLKNQIIYDDDFITLLMDKLNYSEDEADNIRRLFKNKNDFEKMKEFQILVESSDLDIKTKNKINCALTNLSKYGFCKAHSINYACMIYCLYWNKLYNHKNFWKSVINFVKGRYRDWVYIRKGLECGLKFKGIENCSPFYHLIYTGYWLKKDFVSRCYFKKTSCEKNDICNVNACDKYKSNDVCEFRGIIASVGSIVMSENKYQMVITLGYDNNKFINLHLNKKRDLSRFKQIIGKGFWIDGSNPHIVVTKMTLM